MRLVADANVLLSAVTGGRAWSVLARPDLAEVLTTTAALDEVHEDAEPFARTLRLPLNTELLAVTTLPVTVVERDESTALSEAERRIGQRTQTTSRGTGVVQREGLRGGRVAWSTTARLLKTLELGRG